MQSISLTEHINGETIFFNIFQFHGVIFLFLVFKGVNDALNIYMKIVDVYVSLLNYIWLMKIVRIDGIWDFFSKFIKETCLIMNIKQIFWMFYFAWHLWYVYYSLFLYRHNKNFHLLESWIKIIKYKFRSSIHAWSHWHYELRIL